MRSLRFGSDIGLALALCFVLPFSVCRADEPSNHQTEEALSGASDARLVELLSTTSWRQASSVLFDRLSQYYAEGSADDMENVVSGLVAVLHDTSLEERPRVHTLFLLAIPSRFEPTADRVFHAVCTVLLEDPSSYVRFTAAEMLGKLGRAEAIPVLRRAVLDENNIPLVGHYSIRETAISALGGCGPDAAPVLLDLRSNETLSRPERLLCVSALARTGSDKEAFPEVRRIVSTGDPIEVSRAVAGLGGGIHRYSPETQTMIMDIIRGALSHPSHHVREAACNAILYIGEPANIPLLEPLLEDPHMELSRQYDETNIELVEVELYPVRKRAERVLKELHRIAEQRERVAASAASPDRRLHIPNVDRP